MVLLTSIPILTEVITLLALAIPVILILHRLKLPSIVGFLVAGVISGPYLLNLVPAQEDIDFLAEIGVILLLFTIGMEFSIPSLLRIRKAAFVAGSLQLILTTTVFAAITYWSYEYLPVAIFYGFMCTLSSTAIVLKLLQMRGEMGSPHGQIVLAILIFQDIAVVPMMLSMPILAGLSDDILTEVGMLLVKLTAVGVFLYLTSRFVIGRILKIVAETRSTELFISTVVVICFSIAYLTSLAGLSLALGAFLAGLMLSESEYSHHATGYILPFKELFTSIFFISIGMLLDLNFVYYNLLEILYLTIISIAIQAFLAFWAAKALGVPAKTAIYVALSICQIGEFAFVLSRSGTEMGLMPIELYQYFLATSVLTMACAPLLIINSKKIAYFLIYKVPKPKITQKWMTKYLKIPSFLQQAKVGKQFKDHLLIIGGGLNGRTLARGAQLAQLPYLIIEIDPRRIPRDSPHFSHLLFGDAMNEEILHQAHASEAKIVVITIKDIEMTKGIASIIKQKNPKVQIIVRNQRIAQRAELKKAGSDIIITDELETNATLFYHTFEYFAIPEEQMKDLIQEVHQEINDAEVVQAHYIARTILQ